jgi:two-component system, OmpR family, alkaline phosphatase synthesis response regulator PhoP
MQEIKEKKKILIIEDDPNLKEVFVKIFERENFEVIEASNGEDGLRKAFREHPDLVILDMLMPKMDGLTMLKQLRRDNWGHSAPVIILTNVDDAEKMAEALELGVDEYLLKSKWKPEDIVGKVKNLI